MILGSADGTVFSLVPLRYEYALDHPGVMAEDLEWIVVEGHVVLPDGRSWTFTDPCLTVSDAVDLGDWLHGSEPDVEFLEPVIAFSSVDDGDRVRVTAWLSHAAVPPWLKASGEQAAQLHELHLDVSPEQLVAAASAWRSECEPFGPRSLPSPGGAFGRLRRLFGR